MVKVLLIETLAEVIEASGGYFELNPEIQGRSGLTHKPLLLVIFKIRGKEVKYAVFYSETLDLTALVGVLTFYRDTGIQPIVVYNRSSREVLERALELGIIAVKLENKELMLEVFKKIFSKNTQ